MQIFAKNIERKMIPNRKHKKKIEIENKFTFDTTDSSRSFKLSFR
jgi:hypothetical protein